MPGRHIGRGSGGRYECGQHLSARPETDRWRGVVLVRMGRAHRPGFEMSPWPHRRSCRSCAPLGHEDGDGFDRRERVECAEVVAAVASAMLRYVLADKPSELELRAADCGHGVWLHLTYPAWAAGASARRGWPRSCSASIPWLFDGGTVAMRCGRQRGPSTALSEARCSGRPAGRLARRFGTSFSSRAVAPSLGCLH